MKILLSIFIVLALLGCSDRYRYPCQDPENQSNPECNPPACIADGTCSKFLVTTQQKGIK